MFTRKVQLHVHLAGPVGFRALRVLVSHLVGGRLERHASHAARLPGRQRPPHHVHIHMHRTRAQLDHQGPGRNNCATRQLARVSTQPHRVHGAPHSHRHQIRLHLIYQQFNFFSRFVLVSIYLFIFFFLFDLKMFSLFWKFLAQTIKNSFFLF